MNAIKSLFMASSLKSFKTANASQVQNPESILLIQDAHFDQDNQMQITLSEKCVAAVSTDMHLPNQYCQGNCVGWESGYLSDAEFYNSCRIDKALIDLASNTPNGLSYSSCFSPFSPTASHIMDHFEAEFPSSCQSACQDRENCHWFSLIKINDYEKYRCLLISLDSLAIPLAVTASGDLRMCQTQGGSLADCGFGSNLCLSDARSLLTPFDLAILNADPSNMEGLSGPKFCLASSNSISDSICTYSEQLLHKYNKHLTSDSPFAPVFKSAINQFHGLDHLKGAMSFYDEAEWNATFPEEQRDSSMMPHATFIDIQLRHLVEGLLSDNNDD